MGEFFNYIVSAFKDIHFVDVIDMLVVALLVFVLIRYVRDTRAAQFLKGIVVLFIFWWLSDLFNLYATHHILNTVLEFGIIAILIIFQPEIRSILEKMGMLGFKRLSWLGTSELTNSKNAETVGMIEGISSASEYLSKTKTGALMVIERSTKLGDIITSGTPFDADPNSVLISNIFYPKAPLHDGAVIFRNNRIHAAGCFLPLSTQYLGRELGTRHHAAIGVTEVSDAVVVVVSEETGTISIAIGGQLIRDFTPETLKERLKDYLINNSDVNKGFIARVKSVFKKEKEEPEKKDIEKVIEAGQEENHEKDPQ